MKRNVGAADRVIRLLIAAGAAYGGYALGGTWGWVLYVVAGIALLTGLVGTCGLYALLGMSTCPVKR